MQLRTAVLMNVAPTKGQNGLKTKSRAKNLLSSDITKIKVDSTFGNLSGSPG
jgi:hypothetical protein